MPANAASRRVEPGTFSADVEGNMKRNAYLIASEDGVAELERQLKRARMELADHRKVQKHKALLASLRLIGRASTWNELKENDPDHAWRKDIVLAILSCKHNEDKLPEELTEKSWKKYLVTTTSFPSRWLLDDPDIFLARAQRPEFKAQNTVNTMVSWFHHLWNPSFIEDGDWERGKSLGNPKSKRHQALELIIQKFPEVFVTHYLHRPEAQKCQVAAEAETYLRSGHLGYVRSDPPTGRQTAMEFFDCLGIFLKRNIKLMTLATEINPWILPFIEETLKDHACFAKKVAGSTRGKTIEGLQHFSNRLRGMPCVAGAFCHANGKNYLHISKDLRMKNIAVAKAACRDCPILLLTSFPGKIERQLTSDKSFVLSLLNRDICRSARSLPPTFFDILHPALKKDAEIVLAAVKAGVISLDDLPVHWQSNPILAHCLIQSKEIMLNLIQSCPGSRPSLPPWQSELVHAALANSRVLTIQALKYKFLPVVSLDSALYDDTGFWAQAIDTNACLWPICPFNHEAEFIKQLKFPERVMGFIYEAFPSLTYDVFFWQHILQVRGRRNTISKEEGSLKAFRELYPPADLVCADLKTMEMACRADNGFYDDIHESLKSERLILKALMTTSPLSKANMLRIQKVREAHPDLFLEALERVSLEDLEEIYEDPNMVPHEWGGRDFGMAWLSKGGQIDEGNFLEGFVEDHYDDKEVMGLVAGHNEAYFHNASEALLNDKSFLLESIEKNGLLYRYVPTALKHDFDIVLAAWSSSEEVGDVFFAREDYHFMTGFAAHVRGKLRDQDIFFKTVLCGIYANDTQNDCHLQRLLENYGEEMSMAFRRHLAAFLGIPTGLKLSMLRNASEHMEIWGF